MTHSLAVAVLVGFVLMVGVVGDAVVVVAAAAAAAGVVIRAAAVAAFAVAVVVALQAFDVVVVVVAPNRCSLEMLFKSSQLLALLSLLRLWLRL